MKTRLLQVICNQKPVGFLGFENGIYRYHYLQDFEAHEAISPLMPTHRMFYESEQLFPVFSQHLAPQTQGHEALSILEMRGHMGLGHLSFVNPSRPRLLPRVTFDRATLMTFGSWKALNKTVTGKGCVSVGLSAGDFGGLCIHTKPGARYPDQIACPNQPRGASTALVNLLKTATESGLKTPDFEYLPRSGAVLMTRPDLNALGHKMPMHSLASLAGLTPKQANQLFDLTNGKDLTTQAAARVLRFYGLPETSTQTDLNPLNHLWVVGHQVVFLP